MTTEYISGTEIMQKLNNDEVFTQNFMKDCRKMCAAIVHSSHYELGDWTEDDLFDESMVKVLKSIDKYDNTYAFSTWYSTICKNIIMKHYKSYITKNCSEVTSMTDSDGNEVDIFEAVASDDDSEKTIIKNEKSAWNELMGALDELNDNYKNAIRLCYLGGCSVKEAAEKLDATETSVNNWLSRGRKKLRDFCDDKQLQEDLYFEMAA